MSSTDSSQLCPFFNEGLVKAGRAIFRLASVEAVLFVDGSFDRALTVNTIYFWPEPVRALPEIRRVLRPDGVLITAAGTPETMARLPITHHGFRIYDEEALGELHYKAGFRHVVAACSRYTGIST